MKIRITKGDSCSMESTPSSASNDDFRTTPGSTVSEDTNDFTTTNTSTTSTTTSPTKTLQITLYASNLPRQRRGIRTVVPSTFCAVTSLSAAAVATTAEPSRGDQAVVGKKSTNLLSPAVSGVESTTSGTSTNGSGQQEGSKHDQSSQDCHVWGKTEVIQSLHPQWTKCIFLEYTEGTQLYFYVHVFTASDNDQKENSTTSTTSTAAASSSDNKNDLDFESSLGSAVMEVSDILSTEQSTRVKRLRKGGCIYCRVEIAKTPLHYRCLLQFSAELFAQKKSFSKEQAWYEISKAVTSQSSTTTWLVVYRSHVGSATTTSNHRISWDAAELNLGSLCNGDLDKPLRISLQKQARGAPVILGVTETTLRHMLTMTKNDSNTPSNNDDTPDADSKSEVPSDTLKPNELFLQQSYNQQPHIQMVGKLQVIQARVERDNNSPHNNNNNGGVSPREDFLAHENRKLFESTLVIQDQAARTVDLAQLQHQTTQMAASTPPMALAVPLQPPVPCNDYIKSGETKTFQDYIRQGCVLDLCVAIDYTSSNGAPNLEHSLHYQSSSSSSSSGTYNDYEETIHAICNAINPYSSKEHAVWGFGAKFPHDGVVRHLFQCGTAPKVLGTQGVLDAYHSIFQSDFIMSGPTILLQVIQKAALQAQKQHTHMTNTLPSPDLRYTVLLIITDGLAEEFEETQRKLAVYSQMPLSVVIVGVGHNSSDFTKMYHLSQPAVGCRANTTFVEFRNHQHDLTSLGAAALQKVPDQVCEYMRRRGF